MARGGGEAPMISDWSKLHSRPCTTMSTISGTDVSEDGVIISDWLENHLLL